MTSPETLELEAVDAALAGRYVAPEYAELADLALLLRDEAPQPTHAWATNLDRRVEAGFPAHPKKRRDWGWLRVAVPAVAVAAIVVPVIAIGALNGGSDDIGSSSAGGASSAASEAAGDSAQDQAISPDSRTAAPTPPNADLIHARRVEKAAQLTLAAPRRDIDRVAGEVSDVASALGGFVSSSSVSSSSGGDLQLRVPSTRLDTTIQRLSKLGKVRDLSRNTRDITGAVVSARDRLKDARAERKSLLKQLANATTLDETAKLRARLHVVSREIAAARNALARVNNRANFANVSVTLVATRNSAGGGVWTPADAFHDALRVLEVVAGVLLIAAAIALPLLIAWLLGWFARRSVTRRRRERALDMA
jgi:uncharacterized protein DUF4349